MATTTTEATSTNQCSCGCGTMTQVTAATEPCGCGCACCGDLPKSPEQELNELITLRSAIDRRLSELST